MATTGHNVLVRLKLPCRSKRVLPICKLKKYILNLT